MASSGGERPCPPRGAVAVPDPAQSTWVVLESEAAWMVLTGYARRLADGSLELTTKGAQHTLGYLRHAAPDQKQAGSEDR